jgi:serine/threonine protein kinase
LTLDSRYRLEEFFGLGATGELWRGVDLRLSRPVAVKRLFSGAAEHVRLFGPGDPQTVAARELLVKILRS